VRERPVTGWAIIGATKILSVSKDNCGLFSFARLIRKECVSDYRDYVNASRFSRSILSRRLSPLCKRHIFVYLKQQRRSGSSPALIGGIYGDIFGRVNTQPFASACSSLLPACFL
jgi:hypothetical protein